MTKLCLRLSSCNREARTVDISQYIYFVFTGTYLLDREDAMASLRCTQMAALCEW